MKLKPRYHYGVIQKARPDDYIDSYYTEDGIKIKIGKDRIFHKRYYAIDGETKLYKTLSEVRQELERRLKQ